jgi:dipeptide transport system permease protein
MFTRFLTKIIKVIPTLLGICLFSFLVVRLVPGDPVMLLLGERGNNPEIYQEMKKSLGLDLPLQQQFILYIKGLLKGDLGRSLISGEKISSEFFSRFPATLELSTMALFFSLGLGIPLGVFASIKRNTPIDYILMTTSLAGYSMPIFWWGPLLILFFSVHLGLTPVSGRLALDYYVPTYTGFILIDTLRPEIFSEEGLKPFFSALKHFILPTLAMGTIPLAIIARITRSSMLEVLNADFIKTAKAKGQTKFKIIFKHALRNALIPIVTVSGVLLSGLITGAILTETIFSWPGIGKWLVHAVNQRDYPAIQGAVLILGCLVVLINRSVDLIYLVIDPRFRE